MVSAPFKTLSGARRGLRQPEESGSGPLGAGNVVRDPGQRPIGLALKLEAIVGDANRVGSPAPFPNEARAGFDPGPWRRRNPSAGFELRGQGHQSALRHFGRAAMGDLLQPVGDGPHHNIAAQSWRLGPIESPPFQTQVPEAERRQDREAIRQRARPVRRARRSPSLSVSAVRRRPGDARVAGRRTGRRSVHAGRRPNRPSAAAPSFSPSIAWRSRGHREGREGAVDRGAPFLAAL